MSHGGNKTQTSHADEPRPEGTLCSASRLLNATTNSTTTNSTTHVHWGTIRHRPIRRHTSRQTARPLMLAKADVAAARTPRQWAALNRCHTANAGSTTARMATWCSASIFLAFKLFAGSSNYALRKALQRSSPQMACAAYHPHNKPRPFKVPAQLGTNVERSAEQHRSIVTRACKKDGQLFRSPHMSQSHKQPPLSA